MHRGASELTTEERGVVLGLLFYLEEIETRRDFGAYTSLWDYCLKTLRIPEAQAFLRVKATRLIRTYPQAIERLRDGRLNLSTLVALRKALTPENADLLFQKVEGKTKKQAVEIAAMTKARVVAKSSIRPVKPRVVPVPADVAALRLAEQAAAGVTATASPEPSRGPFPEPSSEPLPEPSHEPLPETYLVTGVEDVRDLQPVSATQCKMTVTAPIQFQRDLEELASLVSHRVPDGDLAGILQYAVGKLLNELRKKRGAQPVPGETEASAGHAEQTSRAEAPRLSAEASTRNAEAPRDRTEEGPPPVIQQMDVSFHGVVGSQKNGYRRAHIPEALRRKVWSRDGGRCQRKPKGGATCGSRWQCEIDHIEPVARGGLTVEENLRVLCRRCNQVEERSLFGDEFVDRRIREKKTSRSGPEVAATADPPRRE